MPAVVLGGTRGNLLKLSRNKPLEPTAAETARHARPAVGGGGSAPGR